MYLCLSLFLNSSCDWHKWKKILSQWKIKKNPLAAHSFTLHSSDCNSFITYANHTQKNCPAPQQKKWNMNQCLKEFHSISRMIIMWQSGEKKARISSFLASVFLISISTCSQQCFWSNNSNMHWCVMTLWIDCVKCIRLDTNTCMKLLLSPLLFSLILILYWHFEKIFVKLLLKY